MIPDYTIVIGVDWKHLEQLYWTLQTWRKHKPSLFSHPIVMFYDREEGVLDEGRIRRVLGHEDLSIYEWPPKGVTYAGDPSDKWTHPQRNKMFAGYVYLPAMHVKTPYWLKLDTDAIAMGQDNWIDPDWFVEKMVFVGPRWTFTRPPNQMLELDQWVADNSSVLGEWSERPPLDLVPQPGADRKGHLRACSWCAFFDTKFTQKCALAAELTCGPYQIPVPSQDGYLWYMGTRGDYVVLPVNMKAKGWAVRATMKGIGELVSKSLL